MDDKLENIFNKLANESRLLIEAELYPLQGDRFQPTGFPDLGAATYKRADGTPMLLIESAQSMANRLEAVCWDQARNEIIAPLKGLPHVVVDLGNGMITSSIQEAHRLNSPRIINDESLNKAIRDEVGDPENSLLDLRKLAHAIFKRDSSAVVHGIFLEKVAGRLRLQRLLSSFIEAEGVLPVTSGGVKLDHIAPSGDAAQGYGNVPFSRTEYTSRRIIAYFNLDLTTMRGYGLGGHAEQLLIALSLFKILKLLNSGLRLRTACDLELRLLNVKRPSELNIDLNLLSKLEEALPELISNCEFGPQSTLYIKGQLTAKKRTKESGKPAEAMAEGGDNL
ncbi:MAG: type I-U CRISPR-associated RAMP protein Csb1/Cas7u [Acidobacteriota bacterium]